MDKKKEKRKASPGAQGDILKCQAGRGVTPGLVPAAGTHPHWHLWKWNVWSKGHPRVLCLWLKSGEPLFSNPPEATWNSSGQSFRRCGRLGKIFSPHSLTRRKCWDIINRFNSTLTAAEGACFLAQFQAAMRRAAGRAGSPGGSPGTADHAAQDWDRQRACERTTATHA